MQLTRPMAGYFSSRKPDRDRKSWAKAVPPGRLAGGLYKHTGTFKQFDGNNQRGAQSGVYAVFDQTVLAAAGVSVFAQYGLANADISLIDQHIGTGMQWMGPIPRSSAGLTDLLTTGSGSSLAHFSHDSGVAQKRL